jgi:putative transposase
MTNHVHFLLTPEQLDSISRMIQFVGRKYLTCINHLNGRSGTLWEGRHKGSVIEDNAYLLACMRYIELNPVRAGMTETPGEYRWSSYSNNAPGNKSDLLTRHRLFEKLGSTDEAREHAYRVLFSNALDGERLHQLRAAVQTGTPLGNDRAGQLRRGRPAKNAGK